MAISHKCAMAIAEAIGAAQKHNPWSSATAREAAALLRQTIATNVADVIGQNRPRFRRMQFLAKCGVSNGSVR